MIESHTLARAEALSREPRPVVIRHPLPRRNLLWPRLKRLFTRTPRARSLGACRC